MRRDSVGAYAEGYLRLLYASSLPHLQESFERIPHFSAMRCRQLAKRSGGHFGSVSGAAAAELLAA